MNKEFAIRLSYSAADIFRACPRAFYIQYVLNKTSEFQPHFFTAGQMCHYTVGGILDGQKYEDVKDKPWEMAEKATLDSVYQKYINQVEFAAHLACAIAKTLTFYKPGAIPELDVVMDMQDAKSEEWLEVHKRLPFVNGSDNVMQLVGRADRFNRDFIVDYKFVSSLKSGDEETYMRSTQAQLYAEMVEILYGYKPKEACYVLFKKLKPLKKLGLDYPHGIDPEEYIDKLVLHYGADLLENIKVLRFPIETNFAVEQMAELGSFIVRKFELEKDFWKNSQHCEKYLGCPFREVCWGLGTVEELPERKHDN